MLTQFLSNQTSVSPTGKSGNLIPRNFIRALETDVFTAFAFSDAESTTYLNELRAGANTMKELGMDIWELWHEDKRDSFFFFESEPGLQVFRSFFAPHGRDIHVRFETWVESVMRQYEARVSSCFKSECEEKGSSEQGVYWRLLTYRSPTTRQPLSWHERASEIMDHMAISQNTGAGHDPVPCTIEFLMQKLTHLPEHQIRLRRELRSLLPRDPDARTYSQIDSLPFLNALILEALRVVESIETYQPRLVPPGGCTIESYYLPEGTVVSTQPHLMNNHPAIFPSPETFDPDRWYVQLLLPMLPHRKMNKSSRFLNPLPSVSRLPRGNVDNAAIHQIKELNADEATYYPVMKTALVGIYMDFSTTLVPETDKLWKSGDEACKAEVCFEKMEW
ncbi:hypothetical protein IMSHALPRED_004386 [Imshaugia aleurites]|uniref:Cytochrome P450 n=1 Tax=Imshaugia aleurites TaxID=172621 RepID=A0A8H3F7X0_9LECA|nr:hypothetical protein IMSHALPRED_004386 [Imshaugia aleurites]